MLAGREGVCVRVGGGVCSGGTRTLFVRLIRLLKCLSLFFYFIPVFQNIPGRPRGCTEKRQIIVPLQVQGVPCEQKLPSADKPP